MDPCCILIVDDSPADQFLTKALLSQLAPNAHIHQAHDGKEALDILESEAPAAEVIFLDINMPVMNGHEFLEVYSEWPDPKAPVVMMSSSDNPDDVTCAKAYPCVKEYLTKPISVQTIEQALA